MRSSILCFSLICCLAIPLSLEAQSWDWRDLVRKAEKLHKEHEIKAAARVAEKAVKAAERAPGGDDEAVDKCKSLLMRILGDLIQGYEHEGNYKEAERLREQVLARIEETTKPEYFAVADYLLELARKRKDGKRYGEAEKFYKRALKNVEKPLENKLAEPFRKFFLKRAFRDLAILYKMQGKDAQAEELSKRALQVMSK